MMTKIRIKVFRNWVGKILFGPATDNQRLALNVYLMGSLQSTIRHEDDEVQFEIGKHKEIEWLRR